MSLSHLTKNSFWMVLSRFGVQGLSVLFTVFLARQLGNAGFGEYAFITSLVFVFNALTTFGTDMLLIREIAADEDLSRLPAVLIIQLLLSGIIIVVIWAIGGWFPNQSANAVLALKIYILALIPLAFYTVFTIVLRGKQRLNSYTHLNLASAFLQLSTILFFIKFKSGVVAVSVSLLFVQIISAVLAGIMTSVIVPGFWKIWRFYLRDLLPVLKAAAPIALLTLLGMFYQKLTITMLSLMSGPVQTGIFSAASRAVEASKGIHMAVFVALYPAMAQGISAKRTGRNGPMFTDVEIAYFRVLLVGAMLASLILTIFAVPIVHILYGIDFLQSAQILKILAWTLFPFTINGFLSLSLMASHKEWTIGLVMAVSLLILVILNFWWIHFSGLQGAASAFLVAECIQASLLLMVWLPHYSKQKVTHELSKLS
jgi:O-antigen/teichoic acid export membrane protein